MAAGTSYTDVTVEDLFNYIINTGDNKINEVKIRNYVEKSSEILEHLISIGTVIGKVENIMDDVPELELPVVYMAASENPSGKIGVGPYEENSGVHYMEPLYHEAVSMGVEFIFNTPATEIIMADGKAVGLTCKKADGATTTVNAKSVILATGGYGGSKELVNANKTIVEGKWLGIASTTCTGDGMLLAEKVGAKIRLEDDMTFMGPQGNNYIGTRSFSLLVTPEGKRFTREFDYFFSSTTDLNRAGYSIQYNIVDSNYPSNGIRSAAEVHEAINSGTLISGTTPEELAQNLGMDLAILSGTIKRYNELCHKGVDDDYGKDSQYMIPLGENGATLYAIEMTPNLCDTYGGIYTDNSFRVLNSNDEVIPGLYAAGTCAFADVVNYEYPGCGFAIGICSYMGLTAGETAVTDNNQT